MQNSEKKYQTVYSNFKGIPGAFYVEYDMIKAVFSLTFITKKGHPAISSLCEPPFPPCPTPHGPTFISIMSSLCIQGNSLTSIFQPRLRKPGLK